MIPPFSLHEEKITTSSNIPGKLKLDEHGQLLNTYLTYEGFGAGFIEAYDTVVRDSLPKILTRTPIETKSGKVYFENVYIEKPEVENSTGQLVPMLPSYARNTGKTYSAKIYIDLVLRNNEGKVLEKHERYCIGSYPVMLGSCLCHLTGKTDKELNKMGECPYDPFGYFIVNGSEKVLLIRDKLRENRIMLYFDNILSRNICTITCPSKLGTVQVIVAPSRAKERKNVLEISLRSLPKDNLPNVFQIFRMFGVSTEKEILDLLSLYLPAHHRERVFLTLKPSFVELSIIGDDVNSFIKLFKPESFSKLTNKSHDSKREHVIKQIREDLFPHMEGYPDKLKLHLLAMMVARLGQNLAGLRPIDNRDNWGMKRLETAARSMEQLFFQIWKSILKDAQANVTKETSSKQLMSEIAVVRKYISDTSKVSITKDFVQSFSTVWGVKSGGGKQSTESISEQLKRESTLAIYGHLTKITLKRDPESSSIDLRLLQPSQMGYIGIYETPESKHCGFIKTLAVTAYVSIERPDGPVIALISKYLTQEPTEQNRTPVCVNGKMLGFCDKTHMLDYCKGLKRKLVFAKDTCVVIDFDGVFHIFTDGTRPTRPLLVVDSEDGRLVIEKKNLFNADMPTLLAEGAVEYVDAFEQETILLAQSMWDLERVEKEGFWIRKTIDAMKQSISGTSQIEQIDDRIIELNRELEARSSIKEYQVSEIRLRKELEQIRRNIDRIDFYEMLIDHQGQLELEQIDKQKISDLLEQQANELFDLSQQMKGELKRVSVVQLRIGEEINARRSLKLQLSEVNLRNQISAEVSRIGLLIEKIDSDIGNLFPPGFSKAIVFEQFERQELTLESDQRMKLLSDFEEKLEAQRRIVRQEGKPYLNKLYEEKYAEYVEVLQNVDKENDKKMVDMSRELNELKLLRTRLIGSVDDIKNMLNNTRDQYENFIRRSKFTHCELDPLALVGILGSIIPFPNHGPAPRSTYQCSMGKQALSIYSTNAPLRFDTTFKTLMYPDKPLMQTQTYDALGLDEIGFGQQVILAFAPYYGYNQEDACIINEESIKRGLFKMMKWSTYRHTLQDEGDIKQRFGKPDIKKESEKLRFHALDDNGIARVGTKLGENDVIISFIETSISTGKEKPLYLSLGQGEEGYVHSIVITRIDKALSVKVKIRDVRDYGIADKVACYAPGHEIETANGWIAIEKLNMEIELKTLENGETKFVKPSQITSGLNEDPMILFEEINGDSSLLVTVDHRMYVKIGTIYHSITASKLIGFSVIMKDANGKESKYVGSWYRYSGPVYCCTVPSHIVYVRRKYDLQGKELKYRELWCGQSRYAQKNTVGLIVPAEKLPRTVDGVVPDILINPHCIASRMTIGKLLEVVMSKFGTLTGEIVDGTPFRPFNLEEFMRTLRAYGYQEHGYEPMISGINGKFMEAHLFVGPCYYQALRHHVKDKYQVRGGGGHYNPLSRQPRGGRSVGGALRSGTMERDAFASHGAAYILNDRMCYSSDAYTTMYCKTCGTIPGMDHSATNYVCKNCGDEANFGNFLEPYPTKLLSNYLAGAGANTHLGLRQVGKYETAYQKPEQNELIDEEEEDVSSDL